MKSRKIYTWILAVIVILTASLGFFSNEVKAEEATEPDYQYVILDYEDLLSDDEESELSEHMSLLLEYGNVIFQTVYLSDGISYEQYSEDTYYDYFGNEPGVIFQIDMGHRKLTLSSSTTLDDQIAGERDTIVDNVYRYATDEDYLRCASRCYDEIYEVLNDGQIAHTMKYIDNALLALIISLILNFIIVFSTTKKKASVGEIVAAMAVSATVANVAIQKGKMVKEYSPVSSGSGGSSGGSSGGGGGGGFSGGSSSHGF